MQTQTFFSIQILSNILSVYLEQLNVTPSIHKGTSSRLFLQYNNNTRIYGRRQRITLITTKSSELCIRYDTLYLSELKK